VWIAIEKGPDAGASAEVTAKVFTIGRDPANNLVLTDPKASSRHAAIEIAPDGAYRVRDLQSTNGTFIDGRRLEGAVSITGSERLRIGQTEIQLSRRTAGATVIKPESAVKLDNVSREDWTLGGVALLLAICLLAFPWYHVGISIGPVSVSADRAATSSPYAIWGVLALITSLLLLADLAVERLAPQAKVPAINDSRTLTRMAIAGLTLLLLVIKFLAHVGDFGWGFFLALVAIIGLCYLTWQAYNRGRATAATPPDPAPPPASTRPPT
jgi:pSer/pThr/pTyr-binding forkhead associated (FHA) protein